MAWPDLIIGALLVWGIVSGLRRGFVAEITGLMGIFVAIGAALFYPGLFDGPIAALTHVRGEGAHVIGLFIFAALGYALVAVIGSLLARVARAPVLRQLNAFLGAAFNVLKTLGMVWLTLYVALFFPIGSDMHRALRDSFFVQTITRPNHDLDATVQRSVPGIVHPLTDPIFRQHQV